MLTSLEDSKKICENEEEIEEVLVTVEEVYQQDWTVCTCYSINADPPRCECNTI